MRVGVGTKSRLTATRRAKSGRVKIAASSAPLPKEAPVSAHCSRICRSYRCGDARRCTASAVARQDRNKPRWISRPKGRWCTGRTFSLGQWRRFYKKRTFCRSYYTMPLASAVLFDSLRKAQASLSRNGRVYLTRCPPFFFFVQWINKKVNYSPQLQRLIDADLGDEFGDVGGGSFFSLWIIP